MATQSPTPSDDNYEQESQPTQQVDPFLPGTISTDEVDLSTEKPDAPTPQATQPVTLSKQIVCAVCEHKNRPGTLVCENCGSLLKTSRTNRQATRDLVKDGGKLDEATGADDIPHPATLKNAAYKRGQALHLYIDNANKPVVVHPQALNSQVVIGRHDPITRQSPTVDLDQYAAYRQGVSRKHCALQIVNGVLTISDFGSSNGTFLNDIRLQIRKLQEVVHGDEIRLGQVSIVVEFAQAD
jgi:hypothetical protein